MFASLWDRASEPLILQGHSLRLGDGVLERLLGNHFRRGGGDFATVVFEAGKTDRTRLL